MQAEVKRVMRKGNGTIQGRFQRGYGVYRYMGYGVAQIYDIGMQSTEKQAHRLVRYKGVYVDSSRGRERELGQQTNRQSWNQSEIKGF